LGDELAGGLYGANVAELRQLASKMRAAGQKLEGERRAFSARIAGTSWPGPDGDRFRQDWKADHSRTLGAAVLFLKQAADELVRQANEQESASSGSGGSIARGVLAGVQASVPGPGDVRGKSAAEVRTWWLGLTASQQQAFVQNYPAVAGNTNGIPFSARTEANRANAQHRIDWLNNQGPEPVFNPWMMMMPGYPERYAAEHKAWQERQDGVDYLRKVVAGEVQLAAYDPAANSIVELIGTFDEKTSTVITYVPGTLTNEASFYKGDTQEMARYLVDNDTTHSTVAFVYKGTEFPDGGPEAFLVEAREQYFVDATAPALRDFQAAVDVETPAHAETVAVGHSWGVRNITGSEVAGARYDKVIALSGAAMANGWTPNPHTKYFTYTYPDLLWTAELAGAVGANYPMKEPAFEKYVYAPPGGVDWGDAVSMENHSLIATIGPENEMAMRDIRKEIYR
jgi:hypothetical protein